MLIEHCSSLNDYGLQVAKCLVTDSTGVMPCKILNYTENVVELQQLMDCLAENIDVFAKDIYQLKDCSVLEHEIKLKDETPIVCKQYPLTPQERQEATRQVKAMLDAGILEPSDSPFSLPVIMVQKKDGSMRLVWDLRRLNAQTVYQPCPSHITVDDIQRTTGFNGAKILSTLDVRTGFNQIQSAPLKCMTSGPMLRYAISRRIHYDGVRVMTYFPVQYTFYYPLYLRNKSPILLTVR